MSLSTTTPMLHLTPTPGGFAFAAKYIPLTPNVKVTLGSQVVDSSSNQPSRQATPSSGWFAPKTSSKPNAAPISPLPLSQNHAQVWLEDGKMYISDLESPFGTFVNGTKIQAPTALKNGDTVSLGSPITRNANTPSDITDDHLKPIIAKVVLIGLSG